MTCRRSRGPIAIALVIISRLKRQARIHYSFGVTPFAGMIMGQNNICGCQPTMLPTTAEIETGALSAGALLAVKPCTHNATALSDFRYCRHQSDVHGATSRYKKMLAPLMLSLASVLDDSTRLVRQHGQLLGVI